MPTPVATNTRTHQLLARTDAVAAHHHDKSNPDKPLLLMIGGGSAAFLSLLVAAWQFYAHYLGSDPGTSAPPEVPRNIVLLLVVYFAGLFVFSYGYELYDLKKAIKLTIIAGIAGIAAVAVAFVCIYALGALAKGASGSSSSDSKSSSSGGRSSSGGLLGRVFSGDGSGADGSGLTTLNLDGFGRGIARTANVVINNSNLQLADVNFPRIGARPGCCPQCDQPLDPARVLPEGAYLDENLYCPRCRQPYETVGLKTVDRQPAPPAPPAPQIVTTEHNFRPVAEATCLACGAFLPVGPDGVCAACFNKLTRAAGA